jgi:hypothetical protein
MLRRAPVIFSVLALAASACGPKPPPKPLPTDLPPPEYEPARGYDLSGGKDPKGAAPAAPTAAPAAPPAPAPSPAPKN